MDYEELENYAGLDDLQESQIHYSWFLNKFFVYAPIRKS